VEGLYKDEVFAPTFPEFAERRRDRRRVRIEGGRQCRLIPDAGNDATRSSDVCTVECALHRTPQSVHNRDMRTRANVNLDSDAYSAATAYAAAKGLALGAAISELIRRAEQAPEPPISASSKLVRDAHGFLVFKDPGPIITAEMVRAESEDPLD